MCGRIALLIGIANGLGSFVALVFGTVSMLRTHPNVEDEQRAVMRSLSWPT